MATSRMPLPPLRSTACYGCCCPRHHLCAYFHAVEDADPGETAFIASCLQFGVNGERPMFRTMAIVAVSPVEQRA